MALTIWGKSASGGKYAAIAALTNIPAMLLATLVYELLLVDSSRGDSLSYISVITVLLSRRAFLVLPQAQQQFLNGHKAHLDHKSLDPALNHVANSNHSSTEKAEFKDVEHV
jgi:hypothetical protein